MLFSSAHAHQKVIASFLFCFVVFVVFVVFVFGT